MSLDERVDLEWLDERAEDLADWPDARDERLARDVLYGERSGSVTAAPIDPPLHGKERR